MKPLFELPEVECVFDTSLSIYCLKPKGATVGLSGDEIEEAVRRCNSHEKLVKHVEALKSACETYIPADKMDEANDKIILFCMGNVEEIGRKLLAKQALKEAEKL